MFLGFCDKNSRKTVTAIFIKYFAKSANIWIKTKT